MRATLVGLPLVGLRGDPFGSIPAMPTALPLLAAWMRRLGCAVKVLDAFGEAPTARFAPAPGLAARGLAPAEIARRVDPAADLVGISVHSVAGHTVALQTIRELRARTGAPIVVGGVHPSLVPSDFLEAGARWVVVGDGEPGLAAIVGGGTAGPIVDAGPARDLDALPLPDFEALPLRSYFALGVGHGPVQGRYLNVSTSRGCRHGCGFCATPALSKGCYRALSAGRVVELVRRVVRSLGTTDLHVEDDDFASDRPRVLELCDLLARKGPPIRFTLPSGVRSESLDAEVLRALSAAGCRYLSLAPESGSAAVLRAMGKTLDLDHLVAMVREATRLRIRVGCFVVLGFPGEDGRDRRDTAALVDRLVRAGASDLSVFIWSPLPGARSFDLERGWTRYEELCWTPRWRAGYPRLEAARMGLYARAMATMVGVRPVDVVAAAWRVLAGRYETKGEMTVSRLLRARSA